MENKVDKYLDKVVVFLVKGTTIVYDREEKDLPIITYPFFSPTLLSTFVSYPLYLLPSFSIYVRDNYGLTEEELEYVFDGYRKIILDKIENGK
jgi:hypothetical protein